jgi:hypothetical protein
MTRPTVPGGPVGICSAIALRKPLASSERLHPRVARTDKGDSLPVSVMNDTDQSKSDAPALSVVFEGNPRPHRPAVSLGTSADDEHHNDVRPPEAVRCDCVPGSIGSFPTGCTAVGGAAKPSGRTVDAMTDALVSTESPSGHGRTMTGRSTPFVTIVRSPISVYQEPASVAVGTCRPL